MTTLGLQDTGDTDNIGHTRLRRHWQHWAYKTQDEERENKTHTTQKTKMMKMDPPNKVLEMCK
jgi:hypothetical protein